MQAKIPSTPKEALRLIRTLYFALIIGMVLFGMVMILLGRQTEPPITEKKMINIFFGALLLLATFIISLAERVYRKRIAESRAGRVPLMEKMDAFRAALIVYLAACEGIGNFAFILYFLSGQKLFLAVAALVFLGMLMRFPGHSKVSTELQLSSEEQVQLN